MDNLVIYEDDDQIVEIDRLFHNLVVNNVNYFEIPSDVAKYFVAQVIFKLDEKRGCYDDDIIICTSKVFILEHNANDVMRGPMKVFQDAIDIVEQYDLDDQLERQIAQKRIEKLYGIDGSCEILEKDFMNLRGYFCRAIENKIYIMFFTSYNDQEVL